MCFYVKVGIDFVKESMLNKIKNENRTRQRKYSVKFN